MSEHKPYGAGPLREENKHLREENERLKEAAVQLTMAADDLQARLDDALREKGEERAQRQHLEARLSTAEGQLRLVVAANAEAHINLKRADVVVEVAKATRGWADRRRLDDAIRQYEEEKK